MKGNHKYSVIDDKNNFVFYVGSIDEMQAVLKSFGGHVIKLSGRSEFRRYPEGIERPSKYTDYHALKEY